jgi:hypothetical protein
MNKKKLVATLALIGAGLALVVGTVAYHSASAATANNYLPAKIAQVGNTPRQPDLEKGMPGRPSNQDLAAALGITVEQLNSAYQTANNAAIDQALKAGLITQAQADQLKNNGRTFPYGDHWGGWLAGSEIDMNALLANALGISTDALQDAYVKAYNTRIDQAVSDGNLSQAQADLMKGRFALFNSKAFQSAMQTAFEAAVKQAVSDNVITQAQADQILKAQTGSGFPGFGNSEGFGFGHEGGRGGGHNGKPGGWMPGNGSGGTQSPAAPSTTTPSGGGL